jgi:hypothetical protein
MLIETGNYYELIPADNIKTDLSAGWISSMDEMLGHYFAKLLPWRPDEGNGSRVLAETTEGFLIDAPLFEEENGETAGSGIHMIFDFDYNGRVSFNGIHY